MHYSDTSIIYHPNTPLSITWQTIIHSSSHWQTEPFLSFPFNSPSFSSETVSPLHRNLTLPLFLSSHPVPLRGARRARDAHRDNLVSAIDFVSDVSMGLRWNFGSDYIAPAPLLFPQHLFCALIACFRGRTRVRLIADFARADLLSSSVRLFMYAVVVGSGVFGHFGIFSRSTVISSFHYSLSVHISVWAATVWEPTVGTKQKRNSVNHFFFTLWIIKEKLVEWCLGSPPAVE